MDWYDQNYPKMFSDIQAIGSLYERYICPLLHEGTKTTRVTNYYYRSFLTHSQFYVSQAKKSEITKYLVSLTYQFDSVAQRCGVEEKDRRKKKEPILSEEWFNCAQSVWALKGIDWKEKEKIYLNTFPNLLDGYINIK